MRPALLEVMAAAVPFAVPLRVPFRGVQRRTGLLIEGPAGWGEFSPFEDYAPVMAARWLAAALEAAYDGWPAPVRTSVATNEIVPAVPAAQVRDLLLGLGGEVGAGSRSAVGGGPAPSASTFGWPSGAGPGSLDGAGPVSPSPTLGGTTEVGADPRSPGGAGPAPSSAAPGGTTVKVKVTGDLRADEARLVAVRAAVGPAAAIRVDANAAWTLEQALEQLPRLEAAAGGLEYVEQPLASLAQMAELRRATGVALAVDESVRLATDPFDPALASAVRQAADVVVLKVAPLGGVRAVLRLAVLLDMPVVVSGAMESSVGLAGGIAAAAALPSEPLACGLGTGRLLSADVIETPLVPTNGRLAPMHVAPDPPALEAARGRVDAQDAARLRQRLVDAWEHL